MTDSVITRRSGISGPLTRATAKPVLGDPTQLVKEPYGVLSTPWRVDQSYWVGKPWFGGVNNSNAEWFLEWPATAPEGTALAIKRIQLLAGNDGVANDGMLLTLGIGVPSGTPAVWASMPSKSTQPPTSALCYINTPVSGLIPLVLYPTCDIPTSSSPTSYGGANAPKIFPSWTTHPTDVVDTPLLFPGKGIGAYWTPVPGGIATPTGHQRTGVFIAYDEVTL